MSTEKKLTAMQELISKLNPIFFTEEEANYYLELEKQQIIDSGETALQTDFYIEYESVEDYYNQTFKN